jgi:hypothetical protein
MREGLSRASPAAPGVDERLSWIVDGRWATGEVPVNGLKVQLGDMESAFFLFIYLFMCLFILWYWGLNLGPIP